MIRIRAILISTALAATAAAQGPIINTNSLPNGTVGVAYSVTLSAGGGVGPYVWTAFNLPPGLTVNGSFGIISGTPTVAGNYNIILDAVDSRSFAATKQLSLTITGGAPKITINNTSPLPAATVGRAYNQTLSAGGGTAPYRWAAGQGFPSFFTLNATTGVISGTPTASGTATFPIQVSDSANLSTTTNFTITINPAALSITTVPPLFNGIVGSAYGQSFAATGGVPPYSWSVVGGTAPNGLNLDPVTGNLQGTPQNSGTFNFTIQVADKAGAVVTQSYSVVISAPALTITVVSSLPDGAVGVSYSQKLPVAASGGTAPYTWSIVSGAVPGLSFDPSGVAFSGTPTTAGTFNPNVQVSDANGLTATRSLEHRAGRTDDQHQPAAFQYALQYQLFTGADRDRRTAALHVDGKRAAERLEHECRFRRDQRRAGSFRQSLLRGHGHRQRTEAVFGPLLADGDPA